MLKHAPSPTLADVREIPTPLRALCDTPPTPDGVLSACVSPRLVPVARQAYRATFREGCGALRASLPPAALGDFERATEWARRYLDEALVPRYPSLTLFASCETDYFHGVPLPRRPEEEFAWGAVPSLAPLGQLIDDYERLVGVPFDQRRARIFSVNLGTIEDAQEIQSDVPGKLRTTGCDGRPRPQREAFTAGAPGQASTGGGSGLPRARDAPQPNPSGVTAQIRARAGHLVGHLVSSESGDTTDQAVHRALTQLLRQLERRSARPRGAGPAPSEAFTSVPQRVQPRLPDRLRRASTPELAPSSDGPSPAVIS
ncbi:MAG: hypothetical protein IT305_23850 [Chloroflexi bacterium]|nr:hypothetical protein [Chloroflexota bacterium]